MPSNDQETTAQTPFPIVGIGASAGGLEALETFFEHLPADSGMAVVVVTHTDPKRGSLLPGIIERKTKMAVTVVGSGMTVRPDTVYLPPTHSDLTLRQDRFHLSERRDSNVPHMPVDLFFKSLAEARGERAAGVILSGTGSDGTHGMRAIKAGAGLSVVQQPASARHEGMPTSAIETGVVDLVLTPQQMPDRLIDYFNHPRTTSPVTAKDAQPTTDRLGPILTILAKRTRHDFSLYKSSTLERRISRRMAITHCRGTNAYLKRLDQDQIEVQALFQELLIGVTSFFRDPEAFAFIEAHVLADLLAGNANGAPLRVWIPGCATGEEAYSIAMLLDAAIANSDVSREMQIFATDIDALAIEKARAAHYMPNIAADVTAERLERSFVKADRGYRVRRHIRESVVFADHNLLRDPPFSNLDLLVCRNLLIYLKTEAQNRLIPLFHYTLKKNGVLFLGNSETIGRFPELFQPLSKHFSIFKKKESAVPPRVKFPTGQSRPADAGNENAQTPAHKGDTGLERAIDTLLNESFLPACVVVNPNDEVVYTRGRTGRYLELSPGRPNFNVTDMAREGLRFAMISALRKARSSDAPIVEKGLRVKTNGGHEWIDLTTTRLGPAALKDLVVIVLQSVPAPAEPAPRPAGDTDASRAQPGARSASLEQELLQVRQEYSGAREELETSNQELRSVNEEMQSANEELQSTNEELESSREELQSLNEELSTVNDELQNKIDELRDAYQAITRTLNSTRMAILFLDKKLRVVRFTPEATRMVNLIDSDLGRPLDHIADNLADFDGLTDKAAQVLKSLTPFEDEVATEDGHWYRLNIMIHRQVEHVIEGVVITFVNIDSQKTAQEEIVRINRRALESARHFAENIVDTVREGLLVLDKDLRVLTANKRFYRILAADPEQTEGRPLFELQNGRWDIPELRRLLEKVVDGGEPFEDFALALDVAGRERLRLRLNGRHLVEEDGNQNRILLAIAPERGGEPELPTTDPTTPIDRTVNP